jgi:hypothetical protein
VIPLNIKTNFLLAHLYPQLKITPKFIKKKILSLRREKLCSEKSTMLRIHIFLLLPLTYLINIEDMPTDLTYIDVKAKRTHDLRVLLEMCIEKDKDFLNLPIDDISNLNEYAVEIRYPDEFY